jgi:hypothetical protein
LVAARPRLQSTNAEVLAMPSEWLPIPTVRRRLWSDAKVNRTDIRIGLPLRHLIGSLVTAHIKNYYDGAPPTNSEGVQIIEWTPALEFVSRLQSDIWPPGAVEAPAGGGTSRHPGIKRKRGTKPRTFDRIVATMQAEIAAGQLTRDALNKMTEKEMEARYHASRHTCRHARLVVLGTAAA